MIYPSAIIDTSVLISLYQLDLLSYLNLFYKIIRVPRAVEEEFLTKHPDEIEKSRRFDFLLSFYEINSSWFVRCNEYSSDLISIYLTDKKLDIGEAEVFAQNQAFSNTHEVLLDERKGRIVAAEEQNELHGVLFFIANLELRYNACDYYQCINILKERFRSRFSDSIVDEVYKVEKEKLFM